ncbi:MAG: hypothetical protein H0V56_13595, partial [Chthoniobacterales bacterium]|nr:hypothetical protein [Chthoniobacterales bacterium]
LEATVATLAQRYKDRHPKMMAARAALAEAQAALRREAIAAPAILRNLVEQARAAEQRLEIETKEQEKAALALNKAAIGYQELARLAETERALYESVLRQIQQTDLTKGVRTSAISVVERPTLPGAPVSPRPMKALALGLLGGLAAGLGAIFGLNAIDRSIKTVDQAETLFGMSVLAAVPETTEAASGKSAQPGTVEGTESYRLVAQAPEGPAAEAFRNLRATLSLLGPEEERKVFLFTSAVPSEGKSFASANYALSLAQQGHRVLLIDGDLRRPSLHQIFRTGNGSKRAADGEQVGVVECLVGASTLEAAVGAVAADQIEPGTGTAAQRKNIVTGLGGELFVLAGGRRSPNPAELLSGSAFPTLIAEASRLFDRVVVDSAPVLAVSDTLLMTPHVQTTCLVVRAAKTSRDAVERAIALLQTVASIRPAGIVLNRLPKGAGAGHYYYYASPGYGSGTYGGAQYSDRPLAGTSSSRGSNGAG